MVKTVPIKGIRREKLGTRATHRLRKQGYIPAIVYGHKQESIPVAIHLHEFEHLMHQGAHLFELDIEGHKETVLLKHIQYNYLGTEPIHVDLTRVDLTERVSVMVPIVLRGTAKGVKEGGILQQMLTDIEIECFVADIPDAIKVDISELEKGSSLHAKDIKLPENIKLITDPEAVVAIITEPVEEEIAEAAEETAAAASEPELISKGKEKEEQTEA